MNSMRYIRVLCLLLSVFCVSCDHGYSLYIVNRSNDTIVVGYSENGHVSDLKFLIGSGGERFNMFPSASSDEGSVENIQKALICPDSSACYSVFNTTLFPRSKTRNGYFYLMKKDIVLNTSFNDICNRRQYDSLIVTPGMLENSNRIEYK